MNHYNIAIVGLGPKGLYAFERLLARLRQVGSDIKIVIHLFEKTGFFGAGEIYRTDQPEYLLMNYPNRNINAWSKETPRPLVPETLDFVGWLRKENYSPSEVSGNGFSPRRRVGKYLVDCFNLLEAHNKKSVQVIKYTKEVVDINTQEDDVVLKYVSGGSKLLTTLKVDEAMLTTGHSSCKGKLERNEHGNRSNVVESSAISFVYPVDKKLKSIKRNTTVGVKGLGLTFIDSVLALTEGKGGRFEKLENGNLLYIPSGQEPYKIFPFSRSGLPMIPRNANEGLKSYTPIYFTYENITSKVGVGRKVSFVEHMLPLLIAEMKYRYYRIEFKSHNLNFYPDKNLETFNKQISLFHEQYPQVYTFKFQDFLKARAFEEGASELGALAYRRYLLKEATKGSETSSFMAAAMTWGRLSPTFNTIYSFGGMTADSHAIFDGQYRSILNRISYGPPLQNAKKIMALIETGIISMDFSENPQVQRLDGGWGICTKKLDLQRVDTFVDARIPTLNSTENWSTLFLKMKKNGILRPYRIYNDTTYEAGCPEIDRQGRVVDQSGRSLFNISLYGTPTERITYDNDTLSRNRNNFASQWALNVLKNCKAKTLKSKI